MKKIKALVLTLTMTAILFSSKPSQAAIGSIIAAPAMVTAGVVVAGGAVGAQVAFTALDFLTSPSDVKGASLWALFLSVPLAGLGLLILEGEQTMQFAPLSKAEAQKLGVNSQERAAYNSELDQLNALAEYVDQEISKDGKADLDESVTLWNEVKTAVSPEAFSTLVKVNAQIYHR